MVGGASGIRRGEQTRRGRPSAVADRAPAVHGGAATAKTEIEHRVAQRRRLPRVAHDRRLRNIHRIKRLRILENDNVQ